MWSYSLRISDHPRWRNDDDYSSDVAAALSLAYQDLKSQPHKTEAFLSAYKRVIAHVRSSMSVRQRLHVCYVLATAYIADDEYGLGLRMLDTGLDLAESLHDDGALIELLYLRGSAYRALSLFREAADDYAVCIAILRDQTEEYEEYQNEEPATVDPALELQLLVQLSGFEFMLMRFDVAETLLSQAERLIPQVPGCSMEAATIGWIRALLCRWSGAPERALRYAIATEDVYATAEQAASASRIQTIVADTALDLAETFPNGVRSDAGAACARLANRYAKRALASSRKVKDEGGLGVALLACARYDLMRGRNVDTRANIERVIRMAERLDDACLRVDAQTALGREIEARQNLDSALSAYRSARETAIAYNVQAMGVWAQRAILRASEMKR